MPSNEVATISDLKEMIGEDLIAEFPDTKEDPKPVFVIAKDKSI